MAEGTVPDASGSELEERVMNRRKWLWAALLAVPAVVAGGLAYANSQKAKSYTCPITGEELPCPRCCPLNGEQGQTATGAKAEEPKAAPDGYICPITGERLGCPGCCPLNQKK
jgi:hypothetical protein